MVSTLSPTLFYLMAFVTLFGAIMAGMSKNLFYTAMFFMLSSLGVAGVFASLHLGFLAVIQILVYAGAITILLVFGIMLTRNQGQETTNLYSKHVKGAGVIALALALIMSLIIRTMDFVDAMPFAADQVVYTIGMNLFGFYILPTELGAVLLLVAMIGAVMIARGDE